MTAAHGNTSDDSTGTNRTGTHPGGTGGGTTTGRHARVDAPPSGTTVGADVHDRMTGNANVATPTRTTGDVEHRLKPAKTSAAATFALVFGLAALFCALTAILAPAAVLFGIVGIVLGVVGRKKATLVGVTGRGVALGGLITAVLGLLLGAAVLAGVAVLVNSESGLDRLQTQLEKLQDKAPSPAEVIEQAPAG